MNHRDVREAISVDIRPADTDEETYQVWLSVLRCLTPEQRLLNTLRPGQGSLFGARAVADSAQVPGSRGLAPRLLVTCALFWPGRKLASPRRAGLRVFWVS